MNIWEALWGKIHKKNEPPPVIVRSTDEIREEILKLLLSAHKNTYDIQGASVSYTVLKRGLKRIGLKDSEITSNLIYLKRDDWIEEKIIKHKGDFGDIEEIHFYCISNKGIDYLEGPSKFQKSSKYDGINIENINNVVVTGNDNIVQIQYLELNQSLDLLDGGVRRSNDFSDEEKWNIQADIETIKSQLKKLSPDKGIIQKAWDAIKVVATTGSVVNLIITINKLISQFYS
jgi:hypothetical protein